MSGLVEVADVGSQALDAYLAPFGRLFRDRRGRGRLRLYVDTLLGGAFSLSSGVPNISAKDGRLLNFLTDPQWAWLDMDEIRVQALTANDQHRGAGVLAVVDALIPAPKYGIVAKETHQWRGDRPPQSGQRIIWSYWVTHKAAWPLHAHCYLPLTWAEDPTRRIRSCIPPDLDYQTPEKIAEGLAARSKELGLQPQRTVMLTTNDGIADLEACRSMVPQLYRQLMEAQTIAHDQLGLRAYQGRNWYALHRHFSLVMLAQWFALLQAANRAQVPGASIHKRWVPPSGA